MTHLLHLKKGGVRYNGPVAEAPAAAAAAAAAADGAPSTSGSLFQLVRAWLEEERTERRAAKAEGIDVQPTPMEADMDVSAVGQASPLRLRPAPWPMAHRR